MTEPRVYWARPKKGMAPAPRWVTEAYLRLSKRAHLSEVTVPVCIYRYGYPNAESYCFSGRACLSTYVMQHYTHSDIKALLSHEVGHQTRAMEVSNFTDSLIHILFTLLIICGPVKLVLKHPMIYQIIFWTSGIRRSAIFWMIWAIVLSVIMIGINLYSERRVEYRADKYGAKLYSATAMLDVLLKVDRYDESEHRAIVQMTDEMRLVPKAYLKCLLKLLEFDFNYHGLGMYPSFMQRAKKIERTIRSSKRL